MTDPVPDDTAIGALVAHEKHMKARVIMAMHLASRPGAGDGAELTIRYNEWLASDDALKAARKARRKAALAARCSPEMSGHPREATP